ncbi:hypothetical protein M0811_00172 [Anaeramoeba ignava]|uniref:Uncharacterized protein n=1 Tax=Anaeramoeba ignava TaxID=1746090 RepID=A0A9Q0RE77_ANAIG|nr:hypothetical protein M0811_00172 [Anaeramoeba ignava]
MRVTGFQPHLSTTSWPRKTYRIMCGVAFFIGFILALRVVFYDPKFPENQKDFTQKWQQCRKKEKDSKFLELKKFAVIIPVTFKDEKILFDFLNLWKNFLPDSEMQSKIITDLIFYYQGNFEDNRGSPVKLQIENWMKSNSEIKEMFDTIYYLNAKFENPKSDTILNNRMFYNLLTDADLKIRYRYFFFMNPKVHPIRKDWLLKLHDSSIFSSESFWQKASNLKDFSQKPKDTSFLKTYSPGIYSFSPCFLSFAREIMHSNLRTDFTNAFLQYILSPQNSYKTQYLISQFKMSNLIWITESTVYNFDIQEDFDDVYFTYSLN